MKALARAFRYQRLLDEGRYACISKMAAAERIERGYLGTLLRLTLLAPDLVEALLNGRGPAGSTLLQLLKPLAVGWSGSVVGSGLLAAPSAGDETDREGRKAAKGGRGQNVRFTLVRA